MEENNFLDSKSNSLSVYVLGTCLVVICLITSYKVWHRYRSIETQEITSEISQEAILQEELLDSSSLHPEFIINDGDTLGSILDEAGISNNEASSIIEALSKKFNPRKLNVGTVITMNFNEDRTLKTMVVDISNLKKIEVSRNLNNEFTAAEIIIPLVKKIEKKSGEIKSSFISTALRLSIPSNAIMAMIRAFSYDFDFQRDIRQGDKLEVVMDKFYTEDGKFSHTGDILYSSITTKDRKINIYKFTSSNGQTAYYNQKGENIKKEFLRTPINAAKISSKFGVRRHPVLGYSKMHKGIDFAAPVGTPILAAGSGIIESVLDHYSNYGKYIKIKHSNSYSTVYAHASRFAPGIKPGARVSQGQVVAYVGLTGVTTGPHLHYEVIENGKHINPLKFKFASSSEKLTGKDLEQFKQSVKKVEKFLAS